MKKYTGWSEWNQDYSDLFDSLKSEKHQKLLNNLTYKISSYEGIFNYYREQLLTRDRHYTYQSFRDQCVAALGWALLYMDYFHPDTFSKKEPQRERVYLLCKTVKDLWYCKNKTKWRKLYEKIIDETDNMC